MELFSVIILIILYVVEQILPLVKSVKFNSLLEGILLIGKPIGAAMKEAVVVKEEAVVVAEEKPIASAE